MNEIYPLTIVKDRYSGTYSGGKYLAYNKHPWEIKDGDEFADDVSCMMFWDEEHPIGVGDTPQEATNHLSIKLQTLKQIEQ